MVVQSEEYHYKSFIKDLQELQNSSFSRYNKILEYMDGYTRTVISDEEIINLVMDSAVKLKILTEDNKNKLKEKYNNLSDLSKKMASTFILKAGCEEFIKLISSLFNLNDFEKIMNYLKNDLDKVLNL